MNKTNNQLFHLRIVQVKNIKVALNLLAVFEAINCEESMTKASVVLTLSQPTISHLLSKFGDIFDEPRLVRQRKVM